MYQIDLPIKVSYIHTHTHNSLRRKGFPLLSLNGNKSGSSDYCSLTTTTTNHQQSAYISSNKLLGG